MKIIYFSLIQMFVLSEIIFLLQDIKHVVAKVEKKHFSKNEFFVDFMLFTESSFPEKKIISIFNLFWL